jgi:hypothetical protein
MLVSTTGAELLNADVLVTMPDTAKPQSQDISEKLNRATETEKTIDTAREGYRTVASRAAQLSVMLLNGA